MHTKCTYIHACVRAHTHILRLTDIWSLFTFTCPYLPLGICWLLLLFSVSEEWKHEYLLASNSLYSIYSAYLNHLCFVLFFAATIQYSSTQQFFCIVIWAIQFHCLNVQSNLPAFKIMKYIISWVTGQWLARSPFPNIWYMLNTDSVINFFRLKWILKHEVNKVMS